MGIKKEKSRYRDGVKILQSYGALIVLAILIIINCFMTKNFMNINTIWNLGTQSTTVIILALGMTTVIATGGIDISVGSVMAVSAMILAKILAEGYIPMAILAGLATAVLCGLLSGSLVSCFRIQPMIVTLSMLFIMRGVAKLLNGGVFMDYKNPQFSNIAYIRVGGVIPIQFFLIGFLVVGMHILLNKTRFGVYVEAYGDNAMATKISGINVVFVVTICYVICSVMAGISGIFEAAVVTSADPSNMGNTQELDAIAATVLGGTPISGGKPNVGGTVCGALVLQLITMMVNMNNIPYAYALVLKAAIIVLAIYTQRKSQK